MLATEVTTHVASDRIVFTYGETEGVITGYVDDHNRFVVEHVLALRPGIVLPLLRAGMAEAKAAGCAAVAFGIPDDRPTTRGLMACARRVGCHVYAREDGMTYFEGAL